MEQMEILSSSGFEEMWPIASFKQAYLHTSKLITGCSLATLGDFVDSPDNSALIILRVFIEDSWQIRVGRKYVLGIRFYSFGDIATIDLISLNQGYH